MKIVRKTEKYQENTKKILGDTKKIRNTRTYQEKINNIVRNPKKKANIRKILGNTSTLRKYQEILGKQEILIKY